MKQLIPSQFHFRFAIRCGYRSKMPLSGRRIVDLPASCRLAFPSAMDGLPSFADVRMAWNEKGLGVQWSVAGKKEVLHGEPERATGSDGLSLWLDARDTRTIHRASRFCQRFLFLAHNGADRPAPEIRRKPIHRAIEDAPAVDLSEARLGLFAIDEDGEWKEAASPAKVKSYRMEVFLPASVLVGFDPETNARLGFCYRVRDHERGDQFLAPGPEFPYWEDPSLWSTLLLER